MFSLAFGIQKNLAGNLSCCFCCSVLIDATQVRLFLVSIYRMLILLHHLGVMQDVLDTTNPLLMLVLVGVGTFLFNSHYSNHQRLYYVTLRKFWYQTKHFTRQKVLFFKGKNKIITIMTRLMQFCIKKESGGKSLWLFCPESWAEHHICTFRSKVNKSVLGFSCLCE